MSEELAARLQRLEDERAILDTMYRYGHAIDYGLDEEWLDCFTQDGLWDLTPRNSRPAARYEGQAELARFIAGHTRSPRRWHKHMLVEPRIVLEGNEAAVTSYFVRVDDHDGEPYVRSFGRYKDRLVRSTDGRWRFRERLVESEAFIERNL